MGYSGIQPAASPRVPALPWVPALHGCAATAGMRVGRGIPTLPHPGRTPDLIRGESRDPSGGYTTEPRP